MARVGRPPLNPDATRRLLNIRIDDYTRDRLAEVAQRLGTTRSDLMRQAIRRHLDELDAQAVAEGSAA